MGISIKEGTNAQGEKIPNQSRIFTLILKNPFFEGFYGKHWTDTIKSEKVAYIVMVLYRTQQLPTNKSNVIKRPVSSFPIVHLTQPSPTDPTLDPPPCKKSWIRP